MKPMLSAALTLSCLALPLGAQATFRQFSEATACTDITPDGVTVLMNSFITGEANLWTEAGGLQPIGQVISVTGLSSDGTAVAASRMVAGQETASLWTQAQGWQDLGALIPGDPGCDAFLSSSFDISGDGSIVVGLGWEGCVGHAFRWTAAGGMAELPQLGPKSARANTISRDGLMIGGWDEDPTGPRRPALWYPDGSEVILGETGEVHVVDADGSVAGGELNALAMYWTEETGVVVLGLLPGGFPPEQSGVFALSADASIMGGNSGWGGPFSAGFRAFIFTAASGMEDLRERLVADGADIPETFRLGNVVAIADDERTLVGWGEDLSGAFAEQRGYMARLGEPKWFVAGAGTAGAAGTPALTGSGSLVATEATNLAVKGGVPGALVYIVVGLTRVDDAMKGGILVPSPDVVGLLALDGAGNLDTSFRWPSGLASDTSLFWQAWIVDASGPAGFSATNGLQSIAP